MPLSRETLTAFCSTCNTTKTSSQHGRQQLSATKLTHQCCQTYQHKPTTATNPQATYAGHALKDLTGSGEDPDKKHIIHSHEQLLLNLLGKEARGERGVWNWMKPRVPCLTDWRKMGTVGILWAKFYSGSPNTTPTFRQVCRDCSTSGIISWKNWEMRCFSSSTKPSARGTLQTNHKLHLKVTLGWRESRALCSKPGTKALLTTAECRAEPATNTYIRVRSSFQTPATSSILQAISTEPSYFWDRRSALHQRANGSD